MFHAVAEYIADSLNVKDEVINLISDEQNIISDIINSTSWENAKIIWTINDKASEISDARSN